MLSCATHLSLVHFLDNKSVVLRDDPLYQRFNLNDFGYIDTIIVIFLYYIYIFIYSICYQIAQNDT